MILMISCLETAQEAFFAISSPSSCKFPKSSPF
jgi:hypothetical protein